jgi:hypothetical protein
MMTTKTKASNGEVWVEMITSSRLCRQLSTQTHARAENPPVSFCNLSSAAKANPDLLTICSHGSELYRTIIEQSLDRANDL